jgi:hypothetical protein
MVSQADELNDRMAILDTPPNLSVQQVRDWKAEQGSLNTMWAAIYWPWIRIFNPLGTSPLSVPPSGHLAGVWGRSDDARGVHKAPANEPIAGVKDLELNVTDDEQGGLNDDGINAIRKFRGRGIRVWGARTATQDALDWQYLNVRRLFNYVEESIEEGTQWVVFEPNDPDLWQRITRTVSAFLLTLWRDGALLGRKPEEAFYVKCDHETNTEEDIQKGRVVIEVGLAAVRPAEFVIFRIAQLTRGAQAS